MIDTNTAAQNAIELMAQFNQSATFGFDHKGFITEMELRSQTLRGRALTRTELRNLAKMVRAYLAHA